MLNEVLNEAQNVARNDVQNAALNEIQNKVLNDMLSKSGVAKLHGRNSISALFAIVVSTFCLCSLSFAQSEEQSKPSSPAAPLTAPASSRAPAAATEFQVPALSGPVVDEAGVIDSQTKAVLTNALFALHEKGGTQINVVTLKSLGGLGVEQAALKLGEAWKLGSQKGDDAIILLVAPNERKVRIEVGQGREGVMTDADSKRIIDQTILPLFRSGDFSGGILAGVFQITSKTDPTIDLSSHLQGEMPRARSSRGDRSNALRNLAGGGLLGALLALVLGNPAILIFIVIFLIMIFGRGGRRGGGGWGGGGFIGGGGGWGGGGGRSWSGGGGGFSGGGASGDW